MTEKDRNTLNFIAAIIIVVVLLAGYVGMSHSQRLTEIENGVYRLEDTFNYIVKGGDLTRITRR